ncbi:ATP-binding protein [Alkalihalobacillus sp. BA299]|uniref:ATP-binding protein n=1 Tax=Alkalihalobacillus sp. BA299 TaxID=2815938 RepID=UPI001AD97908|nr:ATP-binding protein [Alkalihalobacillus sp. BA299]
MNLVYKYKKNALVTICLYVILYYLWILIGDGESSGFLMGAGIIGITGALLVVTFLLLSIKTKLDPKEKNFWSIVLIACCCYFTAEILWRYQISFLNNQYNFPSTADVFYIIFVFIYALALLYRVSVFAKRKTLKTIQLFIDAFIIMTVIFTFCWIYFLKPLLSDTNIEPMNQVISLGYPVAHLGLLLGILLVYCSSKPLFSSTVLYLNLIGLSIYIIGDFIYLYKSIYDTYQHFTLLTPVWNIALLLIAYSSFEIETYKKRIIISTENFAFHTRGKHTLIAMPYVSLLAFIFIFLMNREEVVSVFCGAAFVLLLLTIRQMITLKENTELVERLKYRTDELERLQLDLIESKKRYTSLIDYHPYIIFSIDKNGKILIANKASERILGYSKVDLVDQQYFNMIKQNKKNNDSVEYFKKALQGKSLSFEEKLVKKDGRSVDVNVTYIPIIINKDVDGVFVMGEDITEKKKTEELIIKSEKLSVVSRLAAGVAHEIRNPLTTIKGFLQLIHKGELNKQDFMNIIISELNRVEIIIQEFLSLAKPHNENSYRVTNIKKTLKDVTDLLRTNAILKNIEIVFNAENSIPMIECNENQIKQICINLIQNALDATPQTGKIVIDIKSRENKQIVVRIIDNGCGIPKDRIHRLGEPYYSTKEKGTGIGLMVCYKIIEQHNGMLTIFSEENKGTEVEVVLPMMQEKKSTVERLIETKSV